MPEQFIEKFIGVHSADAEQVQMQYKGGDFVLAYVDWQEKSQTVVILDTLAFRWQEYDDAKCLRDDTTYEVVQSKWLEEQVSALPNPADYAHYKVCFNACGVLDILCRKISLQQQVLANTQPTHQP